MMNTAISRRDFAKGALAAAGAMAAEGFSFADTPAPGREPPKEQIPLVDYHVHRDGTTLEKLLAISRQKHIKFGIVEHAGKKENKYPVILSSDDELRQYIASLEGKPVFKGVQAEWLDWMSCFSKEMIAQLDYVLTDAWTLRDQNGKKVRMWDREFRVGDPQKFMDRYVDFHVELMDKEPIDILANATWLPGGLQKQYETLWTPKRVQRVIDAVLKHGVAVEITSQYLVPKLSWLRVAKAAGVKFSFGSNYRYPKTASNSGFWIEMIKAVPLTQSDIFTPAPPGKKPIQRRRPSENRETSAPPATARAAMRVE
jgi:histidinol phosphatase-like PHP family hydrolase